MLFQLEPMRWKRIVLPLVGIGEMVPRRAEWAEIGVRGGSGHQEGNMIETPAYPSSTGYCGAYRFRTSARQTQIPGIADYKVPTLQGCSLPVPRHEGRWALKNTPIGPSAGYGDRPTLKKSPPFRKREWVRRGRLGLSIRCWRQMLAPKKAPRRTGTGQDP